MFGPMAMTVIIALVAAFVLSITFVPAMIATCITGKVEEKGKQDYFYGEIWLCTDAELVFE